MLAGGPRRPVRVRPLRLEQAEQSLAKRRRGFAPACAPARLSWTRKHLLKQTFQARSSLSARSHDIKFDSHGHESAVLVSEDSPPGMIERARVNPLERVGTNRERTSSRRRARANKSKTLTRIALALSRARSWPRLQSSPMMISIVRPTCAREMCLASKFWNFLSLGGNDAKRNLGGPQVERPRLD